MVTMTWAILVADVLVSKGVLTAHTDTLLPCDGTESKFREVELVDAVSGPYSCRFSVDAANGRHSQDEAVEFRYVVRCAGLLAGTAAVSWCSKLS